MQGDIEANRVPAIARDQWTALLSLKGGPDRKTRLARQLSLDQRQQLASAMFLHVKQILSDCPRIQNIVLLSIDREGGWDGGFVPDLGRGLNAELSAAVDYLSVSSLLVIHADLPLLAVDDVTALLDASEVTGYAIAPDRGGSGTNAIALRDPRGFCFRFGTNSFETHSRAGQYPPEIVRRAGLADDIDTWEDLQMLLGQRPSLSSRDGSRDVLDSCKYIVDHAKSPMMEMIIP